MSKFNLIKAKKFAPEMYAILKAIIVNDLGEFFYAQWSWDEDAEKPGMWMMPIDDYYQKDWIEIKNVVKYVSLEKILKK